MKHSVTCLVKNWKGLKNNLDAPGVVDEAKRLIARIIHTS